MEEILASIRRIIADDQAHQSPLSHADSLTSTLDDNMGAITFEVSAFEAAKTIPDALPLAKDKIDRAGTHANKQATKTAPLQTELPENVVQEPAVMKPAASPNAASPQEPAPSVHRVDDRLLSSEADATAASAFESLSSLVLSRNPRTLDDLVQDMLRPLLKSWLDDNLPPLVEKLVRAEIERITRTNR